MRYIQAFYNPKHNSIDINHYNGYIIRIDCSKAEKELSITLGHERILDALAIDKLWNISKCIEKAVNIVKNGISNSRLQEFAIIIIQE